MHFEYCTMFVVASRTCRAYYVHETEEIYTATQVNLAKLTKEPSATYQIRLWPQRGTEVNRPHHGDILLRSPLWFRNRQDKFKLTREKPRELCTHSPRSTTSAQTIQQYTPVAGQPYNSAAAARWLWSRYSSTTMSMRYHCSKSLGDRTFEMPSTWR